jgi:hypothetical protein
MYTCTHEKYKVDKSHIQGSDGLKWCQRCGKVETQDEREEWPLPQDAPYCAEETLARHFAMSAKTPKHKPDQVGK